jgi:hypothetical protein
MKSALVALGLVFFALAPGCSEPEPLMAAADAPPCFVLDGEPTRIDSCWVMDSGAVRCLPSGPNLGNEPRVRRRK